MKQNTKYPYLKLSRCVGILFLLSLLIPTLNWFFVFSQFISDSNANTIQTIIDNEFLFRINIINEIISSIIIILLGIYLYCLLKPIIENLALFAFVLKITEAVITAGLGFLHFIFLITVLDNSSNYEMHHVIGLLINNHILLTVIPGIFFGLSLSIFSYILLKSGYIPRILAMFGLISYILVFIYDSITLLTPEFASIPFIQIIGSVPVCLFQIIIGIWLMIYGITNQKLKKYESNYL